MVTEAREFNDLQVEISNRKVIGTVDRVKVGTLTQRFRNASYN